MTSRRKPRRTPQTLALTILTALVVTGCATDPHKPTAAQAQFAAGQEDAFAMLQRSGIQVVRMVGPFQRPVLPWRHGMTLAQAILEAGYLDPKAPATILIQRGPKAVPINPNTLLQGEDVPVEAGDAVHVFP
jgi:hypothetical protein